MKSIYIALILSRLCCSEKYIIFSVALSMKCPDTETLQTENLHNFILPILCKIYTFYSMYQKTVYFPYLICQYSILMLSKNDVFLFHPVSKHNI